MNSKAPVLFLHGGPGLSAIAERALYGNALPVHWWDQPRSVVLYADPFASLVEAAEDELRRLAEQNERRIKVLAHSFGVHLALRLSARIPEYIDEVVLLAPVCDIGDAFIRLSHRLLVQNPACEPLMLAVEEFQRNRNFDLFAKLAGQVMTLASFIDVYWSREAEARRRWYVDLLAHRPVFDINAFEVILRSFWSVPDVYEQHSPALPVRLIFAAGDPLVDVESEKKAWSSLFRNATSVVLAGGHFIHLEREPSTWWPESWVELGR